MEDLGKEGSDVENILKTKEGEKNLPLMVNFENYLNLTS